MNALFPHDSAALAISAMQRETAVSQMPLAVRIAIFAEVARQKLKVGQNPTREEWAALAREYRNQFFSLKRKLATNPWTYCQRIWSEDRFGERRSGDEEIEAIREDWIMAMWRMNRRVFG